MNLHTHMSDEDVKAYQAEIIESNRAKIAKELISESNLPKRHLECKELDRSSAFGDAESKLMKRLGTGFLVALIGAHGCGKTQLAAEMVKANSNALKRSLYCTAIALFMQIKKSYKPENPESEFDIIRDHSAPHLLIIDEIGKRSENDWENRLLYELINRRYNAVKDTLIISNHTVEQLEASLGNPLISRMQETGGVIECNWESFRK